MNDDIRPVKNMKLCFPRPLSMPLRVMLVYKRGHNSDSFFNRAPSSGLLYTMVHISSEKTKRKLNVKKLTTDVKDKLFCTAFSTAYILFPALALLMAGIREDETATSTDDGN